MQIQRQNYARIRTLTRFYQEASQRGYDQYLLLCEAIENKSLAKYDPELDELERQRDIAGLQTIVFSAMCFESAIYEYAADHLGDAYVKEHLDKLDVLSKWIIVMRLVAGYEFKKDKAPYCALKDLIAARNKLVHSKSEPYDYSNPEAQFKRLMIEEEKVSQSIHNAYRAIVLISMELELRLGTINNPLPSFNPEVDLLLEIPQSMKSIISDCRIILAKANN